MQKPKVKILLVHCIVNSNAIHGNAANNLSCIFFHGDQTQKERMKLMAKMKRLKIKIIVTTDLLARGIDLPKVNIVINFDYCREQNQYLHRIGRTGRFGVNGVAISLLDFENKNPNVAPIPDYLKQRSKNGMMERINSNFEQVASELQTEIDKALNLNPILDPAAVEQAYISKGVELDQDEEGEINLNEDDINIHSQSICGTKRLAAQDINNDSVKNDKTINKEIQILLANKKEALKRKEKLEARKKQLLKMNEAQIPKWIKDDCVLYDSNNFEYYQDGEEEPDIENLNNIAEMLGLPKNMYQHDESNEQNN